MLLEFKDFLTFPPYSHSTYRPYYVLKNITMFNFLLSVERNNWCNSVPIAINKIQVFDMNSRLIQNIVNIFKRYYKY